jgi:membrane protein YqaA with SNARE-associated domain
MRKFFGLIHFIFELVHKLHVWSISKVRKMYDWVLDWGNSKYATWALFLLAVAESSFFPIPPDVLLIFLSVNMSKRSFWYATVCTVGSIVGGMIGYFIGLGFYETLGAPIISLLGLTDGFAQVGQLFADNAFLAIITSALTPIPYKVFTIAAGLWKVNFGTFLLASVLGRGVRFFLVGLMIFFFGKRIKTFIEKYFNWITWGVLIVIIAGFFSIRYLHLL